MSDTPVVGLTEAEENDFRVLLTKIREHDPQYLAELVVGCSSFTQPTDTIKMYHLFDTDEILTNLVVVAKGVGVASRTGRCISQMLEDGV